MLDTTTKKRIDDCRDILVGKLPDPKSQIEQITIGLIYKFMDDMDKEAVDLGGEAKFFSGDYAKYSWDALFDTKVTASEMLKLYSGALESMEKNPNIPQLFRDIFNNAYLPYRDPETLKLFLKTIGEFEYTHSEKLGDAFEYLLSIMGSQGDAGMFRTPRHIIDFIVEVVSPQKTDTILDPACGTAGFLISAFKHIKTENQNKLTPDDQKRLIKNIVGYDISPDMVRLSLVNLYLHGFSNPHISEYDTLSSEDRWDETFDVVLANPPFMSPKGGIRPHKRFGIQSKRSEVLFVDYIAEHLNSKGRAGVIVPEGVIFQSGTAYKDLRKMLVDNYLYAVVSLPAGVFNPYSGVKTSILLMDKELAKTDDEILFVKIDNDGYNLGAQRTPIKGSQLDEAIEVIKNYKLKINNDSDIAHSVLKSKIAENGEYNLSGERYKSQIIINSDFPLIDFEESLDKVTYTTKIKSSDYLQTGIYPIIDQSEDFIAGYWNKGEDVFRIIKPITIFGDHTRCFKYVDFDFVLGADGVKILQPIKKYNPKFFFYLIKNINIKNLGYSRHYKELKDKKIPLPPLSVQEEIVAEIDGYQKIIDGAKMVVDNYKPKIDIDPSWEMSDLGTTADIRTGKLNANEATENGKYPFFTCSKGIYSIDEFAFDCEALMLSGNNASAVYDVKYYNGKFNAYQRTYVITIKKDFDSKLLYPFLQNMMEQQLNDLKNKSVGGLTKYLTLPVVKEIKVPIPPFEIQKQIVSQIEKEQVLVNANKELIEIYEQKIKDRIAKVWGEEKKEKEEDLGMVAEPEEEYK